MRRFFSGRIFNGFLAYAGWLLCIHAVANQHPWWAIGAVAIVLIVHMINTPTFLIDIKLLAVMAVVGTLLDTSYIHAGLLQYKGGYPGINWLAPAWVTSLWALFSISFNHSLRWLEGYWPISALFGAVGAPMTYIVVVKMNAAQWEAPQFLVLTVLAVIWSILFPMLFSFNRWLRQNGNHSADKI